MSKSCPYASKWPPFSVTNFFNLRTTARARIDRSVKDSSRIVGSPVRRFRRDHGRRYIRLVCILGDPDPKGPIFFLHLNEIDKYILRTKS